MKYGFLAFLALKMALKVNYDLEFEISGHCFLCKTILSYLYRANLSFLIRSKFTTLQFVSGDSNINI